MGLVVDSATRRPLSAVTVLLARLPAADPPPGDARAETRPVMVAYAFTARDGTFLLNAPAPGRYQVRLGDGLAGPVLALASADSVDQHVYPVARSAAGALFESQVTKQAAQVPGTIQLRYPPELQAGNVEGKVVAQFVVDTAGRAEMDTWDVLEFTHALFAQAVYDAVSSARFAPAEVRGRKVRQLAHVPFTFTINR